MFMRKRESEAEIELRRTKRFYVYNRIVYHEYI